MTLQLPKPGDLILVQKSEWPALKDGQRLRVCESPSWYPEGEAIFVTPRDNARTFWGPDFGPPNGSTSERMRTCGHPFRTILLADAPGLTASRQIEDFFWHWAGRPCYECQQEYQRAVTLWVLPLLTDHESRLAAYVRKEVV